MIKAIIVDDEKDGREALSKILASYCKNVEVVALAPSVEEAMKAIDQWKPDILFLDIEMPLETGFDLLRKLETYTFKTIIITAHSHYAIKAFKFSAIDYLLKPIDIDDLIEAVKKVEKAISEKSGMQETPSAKGTEKNAQHKISLPVRDGIVYLAIPEIIRFEADGSYTTAHIADGKTYMVSKNIGEYEAMLTENNFFRCHISHLVNLKHVKRFSRHDGYYADMSDGTRIEIARRKKDDFVLRMNQLE